MRPPTLESRQETAAAVAQRLYGFRPTRVYGLASGGAGLLRVEFGGLPAKLIKLPGRVSGLLREQRVVRRLRRWHRALPVPAIEFTQADLPEDFGPRAVTVLRDEPGMPLSDAILRGESWTGGAMREAGAFAARLAEVSSASLRAAGPVATGRWLEMMVRRVSPVVGGADAQALVRLQAAVGACRTPARALVNGRLVVSEIIAHNAPAGVRLCVMNWESARAGPATWDLAMLLASLAELPVSDGDRAFLRRRAVDGFCDGLAGDPGALEHASSGAVPGLEALAMFWIARQHLDAGRMQPAARLAKLAATVCNP